MPASIGVKYIGFEVANHTRWLIKLAPTHAITKSKVAARANLFHFRFVGIQKYYHAFRPIWTVFVTLIS